MNPSYLDLKHSNSKITFNESKIQETFQNEETDESSGWKLVDAFYRDGVIVCESPEVDLDTGNLVLFDRHGIADRIKKNQYNSSGRQLLEEISQWLQNRSISKETPGTCFF